MYVILMWFVSITQGKFFNSNVTGPSQKLINQ